MQIHKDEVDCYAKVTYHLVPTKLHSSLSTCLCLPITITGADSKFTHFITNVNTGTLEQVKIHKCTIAPSIGSGKGGAAVPPELKVFHSLQ